MLFAFILHTQPTWPPPCPWFFFPIDLGQPPRNSLSVVSMDDSSSWAAGVSVQTSSSCQNSIHASPLNQGSLCVCPLATASFRSFPQQINWTQRAKLAPERKASRARVFLPAGELLQRKQDDDRRRDSLLCLWLRRRRRNHAADKKETAFAKPEHLFWWRNPRCLLWEECDPFFILYYIFIIIVNLSCHWEMTLIRTLRSNHTPFIYLYIST